MRLDRADAVGRRDGFTLVELLVVIGVILILTVMTIGAINLSITGERVRSAGRTVQSVIEGARDRAVYAGEPRGVRLLLNEEITEDTDGDPMTPEIPTMVNAFVYIGSPGVDMEEQDRSNLDGDTDFTELTKYVQLVDPAMADADMWPLVDPRRRAIIGVNTNWTTLYERGLIDESTTIIIKSDGGGECEFPIDPRSFPVKRELDNYIPGGFGGMGGNVNGTPPFSTATAQHEILYLLWRPHDGPPLWDQGCLTGQASNTAGMHYDTPGLGYSIQLNADILPGEEPSPLPKGVVIDMQTSRETSLDSRSGKFPPGWWTGTQFSSRMDFLYSPSGAIIGDAGAEGLVHLHISDVGDATIGTPPGSLTKTSGEPREGDELGVTVFTRAGRAIVHPMDTDPMNPWSFGKSGEVAK